MRTEAYELMAEHAEEHWWFVARQKILLSVFRRHVRDGAEVLDFGCGGGANSKALSDAGYRVTGGDTHPIAIETASRLGLPVLQLSEAVPEPRFDCVLASDVLEHNEDEGEMIAACSSWLKPGGKLIVIVPAYEFLWSGEDYVSNHVRRYTRGALERALRASGFEARFSSYFNTLLFPVAALCILYGRLFRPRSMYESNLKLPSDRINRGLARIFASEARLLDLVTLPFGLSILAVAERSAAAKRASL